MLNLTRIYNRRRHQFCLPAVPDDCTSVFDTTPEALALPGGVDRTVKGMALLTQSAVKPGVNGKCYKVFEFTGAQFQRFMDWLFEDQAMGANNPLETDLGD